MNILYIEDEPNDARLIERYFHATAHTLNIASNLQMAESMLAQTPDLILVDVLLDKRREGYSFVRHIRAQGYDRPVIAVTGLSLPQEVDQCYDAGCSAVLTKPFTMSEFDTLLKQYIPN